MKKLIFLAVLVPGLAFASIGKVTLLEGKAQRTASDGTKTELAKDAELDVGDTIHVDAKSNVKLTLNDASELCLSESSELVIDEATFAGQERKGFSAHLSFGKIWAHVSKVLSGNQAKFEVKAARAVAGVRGTIFRVDAIPNVAKTGGGNGTGLCIKRTVVRVTEGRVAVNAQVKPAAGSKSAAKPDAGARHQIAGPKEITAAEWEDRFTELQKNQQVVIGDTSFDTAPYDPKQKDGFDAFVERAMASSK